MTNQEHYWSWLLSTSRRAATTAMAIGIMLALTAGVAESAPPSKYSVVYNFTGGTDGANPFAGLTIDAAGNIYVSGRANDLTGSTFWIVRKLTAEKAK